MFRVFHYINEVYREQSFSKAAQKLYIAQPSLSLTIKKFEEEIGLQIFDRSSSPIQLTEAGKVYMEGVQRILAVQSDLEAYLDDYKELKTGSLSLGAPHMFSSYLLPGLIAHFGSQYPGITIRLVEADFLSLRALALAGDIDLLVESEKLAPESFRSYPLFKEEVILAVPNQLALPLGLPGRLTVADIRADRHLQPDWPAQPLAPFREQPFLLLEKGHDMHTRALGFCQNQGFEPHMAMSLNQLMTVYNLCDQQLGLSFVTDTVVKLCNRGDNLSFFKLEGEHSIRYINLAHKRNRYISRPMQEFITMMRESSARGICGLAAAHC